MPIVDMIGGAGSFPVITALMNSRPDIPEASDNVAIGSCQVTVRVRAFESVNPSLKTAPSAKAFPLPGITQGSGKRREYREHAEGGNR